MRRRRIGARRRPYRRQKRSYTFKQYKEHSLYTITVNGKVYVGYTSRDPHIRLGEHLDNARAGKRNKLYSALRAHNYKYEFKIRKVYKTEFRALCGEIRMIEEYDSVYNGLNILPGGQGATMEVIRNGNIYERRLKNA